MVFCVRLDLKMEKGKIAAQCCHACLGVYKRALRTAEPMVKAWEHTGQAKITLKCPDEPTMDDLLARARKAKLPADVVMDAGHTQVEAGSRTVLAIFGPAAMVDEITGHLKLF